MLPLLLLNGHRLGGWWTIFGGGGEKAHLSYSDFLTFSSSYFILFFS